MSIQIFLDNYSTQCFPGQTISGRVECIFNKIKNLRAIRLKFFGSSLTYWSESGSSKSKGSDDYRSEEIYMKTEYNLVTGDDKFSLPAGKYVYPFSYILPSQLPSSFEGSVGNIRYYVKAVVDRPWKIRNYEAKVFLNVVSLIDLNLIPGLQEPVAISGDKTISSFWRNDSSALTFNLSMPISGYYPGQKINLAAYIKNLTNISARSVNFKVVAHYEYIAQHCRRSATKLDSDEIVKCVEGGVGAHGEKSWTSTLVIPTDRVYPNLIPCSIINLHYSLMAEVVLPFPRINLKLEVPITIGNVADVNTRSPGPSLYDDKFSFSSENNFCQINPPFNNSNGYYPEKYSEGVLPSYLFGGKADAPSAPLVKPSLYSPGASAPSLEVVSFYPFDARKSPPYNPTSDGSIPFHASPSPTYKES